MSSLSNEELAETIQRDLRRVEEQIKDLRITYETLRRDFAQGFVPNTILELRLANINQQLAAVIERFQNNERQQSERIAAIEKQAERDKESVEKAETMRAQHGMSAKNFTVMVIGLCFSSFSGLGGLVIGLIELLSRR